MGTNNFYNHENGIFVVNQSDWNDAYNSMKEFLLENEEDREPTDDEIYCELGFMNERELDFFEDELYSVIRKNKYTIKEIGRHEYNIYAPRKSNSSYEKLVAKIYLKSGYYGGVQVIVETDPEELFNMYYFDTKSELLDVYTPNHKRLLKIIASITTPIQKIGQFSDGTAVYQLCS